MGTWAESTRMAVAGPRLAECGTNGAGSPSTSRPCSPTFVQINPEGGTQSGGEWGRQSAAPHSNTDKLDEWQGVKQTTQPRAPVWGNKASKL